MRTVMVLVMVLAACGDNLGGGEIGPDAGVMVDAWEADLSICRELEAATVAAPDVAEVRIEGRIVTPGTYRFEDKTTVTTWSRRWDGKLGSYGVNEGSTVVACTWRDAL